MKHWTCPKTNSEWNLAGGRKGTKDKNIRNLKVYQSMCDVCMHTHIHPAKHVYLRTSEELQPYRFFHCALTGLYGEYSM